MKVIEDDVPQLHYIFYYILQQMVNSIVSADYDRFSDLVLLFETIASPLLSKTERQNLREIKKAMKKYIVLLNQIILHITNQIKNEEELKNILMVCEELQKYIEYRFSHIIARVIMQALGKKCLEDVIPPDASKYNLVQEYHDLIEDLNIKLQTYGFPPPDLSDIQIRQKERNNEEVEEEWITE